MLCQSAPNMGASVNLYYVNPGKQLEIEKSEVVSLRLQLF